MLPQPGGGELQAGAAHDQVSAEETCIFIVSVAMARHGVCV